MPGQIQQSEIACKWIRDVYALKQQLDFSCNENNVTINHMELFLHVLFMFLSKPYSIIIVDVLFVVLTFRKIKLDVFVLNLLGYIKSLVKQK